MTPRVRQALDTYARDVSLLAASETATEPSYYPAIKSLLEAVLNHLELPLEVRASTLEARRGGGRDAPDFAVYDGPGGFVMLYVEAKGPTADIVDLARSTEQRDQIGRYLAATGAVLLCTVREFAVVTTRPNTDRSVPIAPADRELSQTIRLWESDRGFREARHISDERGAELSELLEDVLTRHTPIASAETLARVLARQARRAAADLPAEFSSSVSSLQDDFARGLGITFEGEEGEHFFRSSLVQTVFYGMFAGWLLHASEWRVTPDNDYDWERTGEYLRIPFLAGLFHDIRNPRRIRELGLRPHLQIAAATLGRVDKREFFRRLGSVDEAQFTSAIVYFYEPFLAAFDPTLREELGVWYTPPEIVRYQVRRVDRLLREELNCPRGLADESVTVLDPACGTGAYLIETLRCIAETLSTEGVGAELAATLRTALERRIRGFEILTAPFVIAHLQLYLLLAELGAPPDEAHRAGVYLTNALTGWSETSRTVLHFAELQEEHDAAQRVKQDARIVVVLGNPPYNRFVGAAIHEEASLVDPYKGVRRNDKGTQVGQSQLWTKWKVRKQLLDDLYVRFFRLAEECIGLRAEFGIVSYISNSSFLTGRSHPLMRESLLGSFDAVWVDNLNGDKYKTGKVIPAGAPGAGGVDASAFLLEAGTGIQVGTCISTWVKRSGHVRGAAACQTHIRDFWGRAEDKRQALIASLDMNTWPNEVLVAAARRPEGPRPYIQFQTDESRRWKLLPYEVAGGYEVWPSVDELFVASCAGVNPNRGLDGTLIDVDRPRLTARMRRYFSGATDEEVFTELPALGEAYAGYDATAVRAELIASATFADSRIVPYAIRPLDNRWLYYETESRLLNRPRPELAAQLDQNEFLIVVNESRRASETKPLFAHCAFDLHLFDVGAQAFFAERRMRIEQALDTGEPQYERVANLQPGVWAGLSRLWHLNPELRSGDAKSAARSLIRLALAIGHAPAFQRDFSGSLAHDWIHLPIPRERTVFEQLGNLGEQVATLLDPLAPPGRLRATLGELLAQRAARLAVLSTTDGRAALDQDLRVEIAHFAAAPGGWRPRQIAPEDAWNEGWGDRTGDLYINERVFFRNVPERVWRMELGGYPVLKKWLGYREARRRDQQPLTLAEKDELRSIVHRLAALSLLEPALDDAYMRVTNDAFTAEDLGVAL